MTAKFDAQLTPVLYKGEATEHLVRFKRDGKKIVGIQVYRQMQGELKAGTYFGLGDHAEYDSFNMSYYGLIETLTEKTVTITKTRGANVRKYRLDLHKFCWRNWNFDLETTMRNNEIESQNI